MKAGSAVSFWPKNINTITNLLRWSCTFIYKDRSSEMDLMIKFYETIMNNCLHHNSNRFTLISPHTRCWLSSKQAYNAHSSTISLPVLMSAAHSLHPEQRHWACQDKLLQITYTVSTLCPQIQPKNSSPLNNLGLNRTQTCHSHINLSFPQLTLIQLALNNNPSFSFPI